MRYPNTVTESLELQLELREDILLDTIYAHYFHNDSTRIRVFL